ncbi:MAG: (d)CMP kinase [Bacteroidota bacterium]
MKKITIAIDGYSSCGKSTLAKALAAKLGYSYVDSGAMYRAVTYFFLQNQVIPASNLEFEEEKVLHALNQIHLTFVYNPALKASETYLNEVNVEKEIREMHVSQHVSKVSAIKEVRTRLVAIQQKLGKSKGVVMDGRDIGTVVFPDAELKLFMTADIDVRAQRRFDELTSKGNKISMDEVKQNLWQRDYDDTHRKENPLTKAEDAIILDNSDLNRQQQLEFVTKLIDDLLLIKDFNEAH